MWSLRRWTDPAWKREEDDRQRLAEHEPPSVPGGPADARDPWRPAAQVGRFRCRVCGAEGTEPSYCASCLADTMRPVSDAR